LLILNFNRHKYGQRNSQHFRYEASWALDNEYKTLIEKAWKQPTTLAGNWSNIQQKLSRCKAHSMRWQKQTRGPAQSIINSLKTRLNLLQGEEGEVDGYEVRRVKQELQNLLDQENLRWKQRAKINWLKYGDRNTKFYHACANQRKKSNQIYKIKDEQGMIWEAQGDIEKTFVNYFSGLFSTDCAGNLDLCLTHLDKRVTRSMNESLLRPFEVEEVSFALNQMGPLKAPGPDGLSAGFFQNHWDILGDEVCQLVLDILNSKIMHAHLNMTNIALIPKVKNPTCVTEFRPISLCNVLYKLVSKVLANRLKKILSDIISPTQSAFIPGRLITDNILAAYETLHTMQTRLGGKKGFMAVKLDMSKAYDRVEWCFLEGAMKKLGFDDKWIDLIMMCVKSVNYAVVVNGVPCGNIRPTRGLRQGDPISPYLFLICAEVLSSMISQANYDGVLTGVPTSKRGPRVSHLFFADDSLLFCRANISQWEALTRLLRIYEEASGQRLNNNKTAMYFSRNTSEMDKNGIAEASGIPVSQCYDSYLGLPAMVGKSRTAAFRGIIDKVWKRLQDWKLKFLSQAGKEVLLKAVIQAIPTFCMSVFLFPKALCSEINSLMQKFWWCKPNGEPRVHWMNWRNMGTRKKEGGMGFRDFRSFNKALLAKQCWRLWQNPDSFLAKIMKGKYFAGSTFLEASLGARPSYAWRSIHSSCSLLKAGLIWRVGNGARIRIWKDKWLPRPTTYMIHSSPIGLHPETTVSALIKEDTRWWDLTALNYMFSKEEVSIIQSIPVSMSNKEDRCIWRGTKNGQFTVRSAYHLQQELNIQYEASSSFKERCSEVWSKIWSLQLPGVEKKFLWKACKEILPTRANLFKRKVVDNPLCPICSREPESVLHILWSCDSARDAWCVSSRRLQKKSSMTFGNFFQVVEDTFEQGDSEEIRLFVGIARRLWLRRNDVVYGGSLLHPSLLVQRAIVAREEYTQANEAGVGVSMQMVSKGPMMWKAPSMGWKKMNWDASIAKDKNWMGFGMVLRDEQGAGNHKLPCMDVSK
jgi:hypothetical protein